MMRFIYIFLCFLFLLIPLNLQAQNLLDEPEGIVYDSVNNRYLVSCWRNGAVVQIDTNEVQDYFKTGLGNCASIIISGDRVYVPLNNNSLAGFDLETAYTEMYVEFPGAQGCHDVAVDTSGYAYATDWRSHRIYKIDLSDNSYTSLVTYTDGIRSPIGIEFDIYNNRLISVPFADDSPIQAVNLADGTVTDIINPHMPRLDGVTRDHLGNYYITTSTGGLNSIYRFDSAFSRPMELIEEGLNGLVDVCFNTRDNILAATVYWEHGVRYIPIYGKVSLDDHRISDDDFGDGDGIWEGGETISLELDIYNSGVEDISELTISLAADDQSLNIVNGSAYFGDIPVQTTVSNDGTPFLIDIPVGYQPRLGIVTFEATWQSKFGIEVDTFEVRVNIGQCSILLVDDDYGDNLESYYTQCFEQASIPYVIMESTSAVSELDAYDIVIWFTGDAMSMPFDGAEVDSLTAFLDNGGKLFLTGQYIAAQLNTSYPDFLNNYLKSEYVSSALYPLLQGQSSGLIFGEDDEIAIYGAGALNNQIAPDHLNAINGGTAELQYFGQSIFGAVTYTGAYQSVFFSFGFEAIVNGDSRYIEREAVMAEILDFFNYQMPDIPMTLSVSPGDAFHMIDHSPQISWQHGDPGYLQSEYHVQVGSDNDWVSAEMWDYGPVSGADTDVIYAGTELSDGMTYYYRVRVYDGADWSTWYYGQLHMNSVPSVPTGLSPDNMDEFETLTPTLTHDNCTDDECDVLTYSYEVYDDELMSSLVAGEADREEDEGGSSSWLVPVELTDGEDYFWRVRAGDGLEYGDWSDLASLYILPAYVCGDANNDAQVNVGDAVFIINYVFKGGAAPVILEAGDANADGECNIGDAVYLISLIFKGGPAPQCP